MNFNINLATRVYVDFRKVNICFTSIILFLCLWISYSIYIIVDNAIMLNKFHEYKSRLELKSVAKKVSEKDYTSFTAKVKSVNAILYKRSYDWLSLLTNLERLVPEGVALKGLEPSEKGAVLRIAGSAKNFLFLRRFIENLEGSKVFKDVYLTDQAPTKDVNQKGISFTVTCKVTSP